MLVLDPVSAPKWRLDCSRCDFLVYLPPNLHHAKVSKERCEVMPNEISPKHSNWNGGSDRLLNLHFALFNVCLASQHQLPC